MYEFKQNIFKDTEGTKQDIEGNKKLSIEKHKMAEASNKRNRQSAGNLFENIENE